MDYSMGERFEIERGDSRAGRLANVEWDFAISS